MYKYPLAEGEWQQEQEDYISCQDPDEAMDNAEEGNGDVDDDGNDGDNGEPIEGKPILVRWWNHVAMVCHLSET